MTLTKASWSTTELSDVRHHLVTACHDLRERLAEHQATAPVCGDVVDQAERIAAATFDDLALERDQVLLARTEHALERLDAGLYDRCEMCDVTIPKERLQALWYASSCLTCAQTSEAQA